ncbi:LLM class flavin-dependent oxidoreductase [Pseudonocardiaceae bacterium YIM PH 21723]|nr:LLM class flavin-dependent oxidoreductase [Pseudonocardiaceae bacterium YIM PH 21723]
MPGDLRLSVILTAQPAAGEPDTDTFARATAIALEAEALGFDCVWTTEHHFSALHRTPSALTLAGYLLGRTSSIHVGTAVTVLPLHSPVHVAEQVALLDVVSGGRFRFGAGRAGPSAAYAAIGRGLRYWEEGFAEALDLVLAGLNGTVSADSELYRIPEVTVVPRPTGSIPVSVAVSSESTVDLAAVRGLATQQFTNVDLATRAARIRRHAELAAPGYYDHGCWVHVQVADTQAEAESILRTHLDRTLGYLLSRRQKLIGTPTKARALSDDPLPGRFARTVANDPVGTPERCAHRLRALAATGCTQAICQVEMTRDLDASLTNLRRLATEVLPAALA